MSSTDALPYSVAMQKAYISNDLNATLMYQFLFGIYTGFFPAAIYLYNARKGIRVRSRDIIIIGSITALYSTTALAVLLNWALVGIALCKHGGTRVDILIESLTGALRYFYWSITESKSSRNRRTAQDTRKSNFNIRLMSGSRYNSEEFRVHSYSRVGLQSVYPSSLPTLSQAIPLKSSDVILAQLPLLWPLVASTTRICASR
ncbi:hypothetical protein CPC08DRAFT_242664 [Agrocybe pediades]|nr:hypothetical protein CPC08DRAFT_242664 [Agrocybe pediades]